MSANGNLSAEYCTKAEVKEFISLDAAGRFAKANGTTSCSVGDYTLP
jgi:hypothetical protein